MDRTPVTRVAIVPAAMLLHGLRSTDKPIVLRIWSSVTFGNSVSSLFIPARFLITQETSDESALAGKTFGNSCEYDDSGYCCAVRNGPVPTSFSHHSIGPNFGCTNVPPSCFAPV